MRESQATQPLALVAASLLLAATGAVLLVLTARLNGSPAAVNRALSDTAATRQVTAAVSAGVSEIYSYSYTDLAATLRAADRVLAGQAAAQYRQLAPELGQAVSERLTVITRVTAIGVSSLTPDAAQLLLFLDQTATRGAGKSSTVPAQLDVTARLSGGTWRITNIESR
jgi:Mce-associated membrane protein